MRDLYVIGTVWQRIPWTLKMTCGRDIDHVPLELSGFETPCGRL